MKTVKKTLYLLKMGMDAEDGRNHRIRFIAKTNELNYCIDFGFYKPFKYVKKRIHTHKIEHTEDCALHCDTYQSDKNGDNATSILNFEQYTKNFEFIEGFENFIKYSYENILKIINNLLKANFEQIELVDSRYIIKFNYDDFDSTTHEHDIENYNKAKQIEEYAKPIITKIKEELHNKKYHNKYYDNSSYYFDGDKFTILIHYNGFNDYVLLDLKDFKKAKEVINNYKAPAKGE